MKTEPGQLYIASQTHKLSVNRIVPARIESLVPESFRLARKPDGELVLQGCFVWREGFERHGHEWRDLPTVILSEGEPA